MKALGVVKEYLTITIGVAVAALAIFFFLVPSNVTVGSVSGLGIVLEKLLPFKLSTITFVINAVLLLIGFIFIGRDFGIKTVYTSLLLPVFLGDRNGHGGMGIKQISFFRP